MKIKKKELAGEIATALQAKLETFGASPKKLKKLIEKASGKLAGKVKKTVAKADKKARKDLKKHDGKTLPAVSASAVTQLPQPE